MIPEDWEVGSLGDEVTKVGSGITPTGGEKVYQEGGRPFMRSQNVGWGQLLLDDIAFISEETHGIFPATEIVYGDVLLNITGASIGRSAIADDRVAGGNVNQHVCIIRTDARRLDAHFLNLFLLSKKGQKQIDSFQAGGNRQGLNFGQIRSFLIPLPPLPEQRAIAAVLSDVDALLSGLEQLIGKKRAIKQATMQQLLTGKVRLPGFEKKQGHRQAEAGIFPRDWKMATLREICIFENGDRGRNYPSPGSFVQSGIPFINAGHISEGKINFIEMNYITPENSDRLGSGKVRAGDIVFCLRGSLGKFGVVADNFGEGAIASSLVIVRPKANAIGREFLGCYFSSALCAQMIDIWSGGAAQPNLGAQDLARFSILLPPTLVEQTAIATVLSDMDAEIAALEQRRDKTRLLKQGMMQELLTGRIRLV